MTTDSPLFEPSSTEAAEALQRVRVVLVEPSHPGNIGAAARAMKTMGLGRLVLVAPERFPDPDAVARATGAEDLLHSAEVVPELEQAIAGCGLVLGCSARRRGVPLPVLAPRGAAGALLDAVEKGSEVALLFGRERSGLANDELQRCQAAVQIPANPEFSSLNLGSAVQVLCYELRVAALGDDKAVGSGALMAEPRTDPPATQDELEGYFGHLAEVLDVIDFHKGRSPDTVLTRLRRLYLRARLDQREVRILRGILAETARSAKMAREGE